MAVKGGPKIINDGLVLCLDAHDAKSYAGEPTTNFVYRETPRIDSSYSSYVYNSDSTWAANHPDAIRVYNTDGTEISSYVNTGANSGNWQVIAHAHWVYDDELRKPVVRMHRVAGYEGQWRALSSSLNHTLSELGLTAGDKFTISWLQKAYVTGVYARAGLYMRNTSGSNNFWAGQATSSDVGQLSSELGKWAHKSKTFTVPSGMNETGFNVALYMYGQYSPTHLNEILISDVQVETRDYATPIVQGVSSTNGYWGVRSATNGWVDRSGNSNSGTLTNMIGTEVSHYRDGQVIMPVANSYLNFDGSDDYVTVSATGTKTVEVWFNPDTTSGTNILYGPHTNGYDNWLSFSTLVGLVGTESADTNNFSIYGGSVSAGNWYQAVAIIDDTTATLYVNGSQVATTTKTFTIGSWSGKATIGRRGALSQSYANAKIGLVKVYNRPLTATEVLQNYNATKGRFGL